MPMNFPDLAALRRSFDHPKALPYRDGESEADYRERCAKWSEDRWGDHIQAQEIRSGKGWDRWGAREFDAAVLDVMKRAGKPSTPPEPTDG